MKKRIGISWMIHIFALLHIATILLCRLAEVRATYFLTVLSIALVAIICLRKRLSPNITIASIVLANIFGILLGQYSLEVAFQIFGANKLNGLISTFATTEIIGWSTVLLTSRIPESRDSDGMKEKHIMYLTVIAFAILLVRIFLESFISGHLFIEHEMQDIISTFFSNPLIFLTLICITIAFIRYLQRLEWTSGKTLIISGHILFFIIVCPMMAGIVTYSLTLKSSWKIDWILFYELLVVAAIVEIVIYSLIFMTNYAISAQHKAMEQKNLANLAKAQYISLKQQVNPHFLFNNLNILDCMVAENKNSEARDFIRHLVGLYRHMLKYEDKPVVTLKEEISYVKMYTELLLVRFPDGLDIKIDLSPEDMERNVVTYSVQMLVENAVKHNATPRTNPLIIRLSSGGDSICVSNNRIPRISPLESTGHGLTYVRQSYLDKCGQHISIVDNKDEFKVYLPFL